MRVSEISTENMYDTQVGPLVAKLITLCKKNHVPLLACSTFNRGDEEGSVCTAVEMEFATKRMTHISAIIANHGVATSGITARIVLGQDDGFDDNWTVKRTKDWDVIEKLADEIAVLVDIKHRFPTALIIQTPTKGVYLVRGSYPSDRYQGIQYMRVIAEHGYSKQAMRELMGGEEGDNDQNDAVLATFARMRELTSVKPTAGKRKARK